MAVLFCIHLLTFRGGGITVKSTIIFVALILGVSIIGAVIINDQYKARADQQQQTTLDQSEAQQVANKQALQGCIAQARQSAAEDPLVAAEGSEQASISACEAEYSN
jgi:predicted lipid-binding transport protein (Tim44 family)